MQVFYSPNYVKCRVAFDTTRKAAKLAELILENHSLEIIEPRPLTEQEVLLGHSQKYVNALKTGEPFELASSAGHFGWDEDRFDLVCSVGGGVLAACETALSNKAAFTLSSGLHHARHGKGAGFCSLGSLAIASLSLLNEQKIERVVVLDLDAHGGGGTWSIAGFHPGFYQANVSVANYDNPIHGGRSLSYLVRDASVYQRAVLEALKWIDKEVKPDLVIYNAGVDIHQDNDIGGLQGIDDQMVIWREQAVANWAKENNYPIAGTVAGGYASKRLDLEGICKLHIQTINALAPLAN